ncbi:MAG: SIR2 family protein [Lachnospiraceae bacterium]|nr:SIR2 family protein [Lachnospiraceae bacterium]
MKIISLEKAEKKQITKLSLNKTIWIVGCGISIDQPTGLPNGADLTDYYLNISLGKETSKRLKSIWKKFSEELNNMVQMDFPLLRLEMIIGNVNKVEDELDNSRKTINGFEEFSKRESNKNHKALYEIARRGSLILTLNFDTGIESAGEIEKFALRNQYNYPAFINEEGVTVYHLHGVAVENEQLEFSLGASIENVKKGLDEYFKQKIVEMLDDNFNLVFVGYSMSDFFDITPFLKCIQTKGEGKIIYFSHGKYPAQEICNKISDVLKNFKNKYIVYGETYEFLHSFCKEKCEGERIEDKKWNFCFEKIHNSWSESVSQSVRYRNIIRISNQTGIRIDLIDPKWKNEIDTVLRELLDSDIDRIFGTQTDLSKTVFSDIREICNSMQYNGNGMLTELIVKIDNSRKNIIAPSKVSNRYNAITIIQYISMKTINPQNYNSAIVYAMVRICKENIVQWWNSEKQEKDWFMLLELHNALKKMLQMPYNEYMYISYYVSLLKVENLLLAILDPLKKNQENERMMMELTLEISNAELATYVLLNYCRKHLILYRRTGKIEYKQKSLDFLNKMNKLCGIIGLKEWNEADVMKNIL